MEALGYAIVILGLAIYFTGPTAARYIEEQRKREEEEENEASDSND